MDNLGRNRRTARTAHKEEDPLEFEWGAIEPVSRKYDAMGGQIDPISLAGMDEKTDFNDQLD